MHVAPRFRILIVEDEPRIRQMLVQYLAGCGHFAVAVESGRSAMREFSAAPFDLVLTDVHLPDVSGLALVDHVKKSGAMTDVILMTGFHDESYAIEAMHHGAYDFFVKPVSLDKLRLTIDRVREKHSLESDRARLALLKREQELQFETTMALCHAAEERDRSNRGHGQRTAVYSLWLAKRLCFTEQKVQDIRLAALLHDIGKIGIDDSILNKPGKLTDAEAKQMRFHSEIGAYILQPVSVLRHIAPIVRSHHEHWCGTGYPDGLAGEQIPIESRILTIADYFDAVTSHRPYRRPETIADAIRLLQSERGGILDPVLTDIFIDLVREKESVRTAPAEESMSS